MGLGILGKTKNKLGNGAASAKNKALTFADRGLETSKTGARVLVDGGKNIAQKGKNAVIDPAKRRLTIIEHQINNHARNPNTQTENVNLDMMKLKKEVEELREIIKEAKVGFKQIKIPWYVTQFGDFILYLTLVSLVSFIIIEFKEPSAMYY